MTDLERLAGLLRTQKYHHTLTDALIVTLIALGVAVLLMWHTVFVMVPAGSAGVLFRLFRNGTETGFHFSEGLAVKWPWDVINIYDVRTQARDWHATVLTYNGLTVEVDYTELFHPVPAEIGLLHKEVGPQYYEAVVRPLTVNAIRRVIAGFNPHEISTTDVTSLSQTVLDQARLNLRDSHVSVDGISVRKVSLPASLDQAITEKLRQQQIAQAYQYRLIAAQREAERRRVEAIGIRTFNAIVSDSLTPSLLTWRGIEATTDIAKSPNAKVVIVGGSKEQLPLILGSDIGNLPPTGTRVPPISGAAEPLPDWTTLKPMFPAEQGFETAPGIESDPLQALPAPSAPSPPAPDEGARLGGLGQR